MLCLQTTGGNEGLLVLGGSALGLQLQSDLGCIERQTDNLR